MSSDSAFASSPLAVSPLVLPSILDSYHTLSGTVNLNLSDKVLIDASEFLNAVYDDMS